VARLVDIRLQAEVCQRCPLAQTRNKVVFGGTSGYRDIRADLMIVGEAPGEEEDETGLPFEWVAGRQLTRLLDQAGLDRATGYITNVVKCRPMATTPDGSIVNRPPHPSEIASCWDYLEAQIRLVRPKVILTLRATSTARLLGPGARIGASRGRGRAHEDCAAVVTYRPSPVSLNRQPGRRAMVMEDLALARELLNRPDELLG
jgi:DNA polymerase